jgi:hypothetical protein
MTELTKVTPLVEKKQEVDEFTWLPISIPRPPARLLLIGSSGCGKSNLAGNFLEKWWVDRETGESYFDVILLMSATIEQDPIYDYLFSNPKLHDKIVPFNKLDYEALEKIENRPDDNLKICVYLDDFANEKKALEHPAILGLFYRGRHANITTILCSQFFYSIHPSIRVNSTGIMIFRLKRDNERILLRLQLSTPRVHDEQFDEMLNEALKGSKYNFLYDDLINQKFYENFDFELCPEGEEEEKKEDLQPEPPKLLRQNAITPPDDIDQEIEKQIDEALKSKKE